MSRTAIMLVVVLTVVSAAAWAYRADHRHTSSSTQPYARFAQELRRDGLTKLHGSWFCVMKVPGARLPCHINTAHGGKVLVFTGTSNFTTSG
jgi:hypothetical protein